MPTTGAATAKPILMNNKIPTDMIKVLETHMINEGGIHTLSLVLRMEDTVTTVRNF